MKFFPNVLPRWVPSGLSYRFHLGGLILDLMRFGHLSGLDLAKDPRLQHLAKLAGSLFCQNLCPIIKTSKPTLAAVCHLSHQKVAGPGLPGCHLEIKTIPQRGNGKKNQRGGGIFSESKCAHFMVQLLLDCTTAD